MAEEIIYSGEHSERSGLWEVHSQRDDGSKHLFLIPKMALSCRAAEYGVDPEDVDTLMDLIMHEFRSPTEMQEDADPGLKSKKLPRLLQVQNTSDALKFHQQRMRQSPIQYKIKGNKALDPIRQGHKPDPGLMKNIAAQVDIARWIYNYGDLPDMPQPVKETPKPIPFVQTGITDDQVNPSADSISQTTISIGSGNSSE